MDAKQEEVTAQKAKKEKQIPCCVRKNGVPCWGIVVSGNGCTNPDCVRSMDCN